MQPLRRAAPFGRLRSTSPHLYGLTITTLGVLVLCPDALLVRLIEDEGGNVWSITLWRGVLTGTALFALYRAFGGPAGLAGAVHLDRWMFIAALLIAFQAVCFVVALTLTSVANTLLIVATAPLFAASFSWLFLGERSPPRTWIATVAALVGIGVIVSNDVGQAGSLGGDLAALGTAAGLGAALVVVRYRRAVNMIPSTALGKLISGLAVAPLAEPFSMSATGFGLMILLGLVLLPISFGLLTLGPRYLPAPEVSLLMLLETVLAPVLVWQLLGERPSNAALFGGVLVIAALVGHAALGLRSVAGQAR